MKVYILHQQDHRLNFDSTFPIMNYELGISNTVSVSVRPYDSTL